MWALYHKILHEKKIPEKNIFWAVGGEISKKVVIFTKKWKKREKAIFFFKNGQIDPKIGQIEVPQYIKLFTLGIFEILSFSNFMTKNGSNFSEKWDFSPFFGKKREISQNLLKIKLKPS